MSIRDLFKGSRNDEDFNKIEEKITELEKQVKRINTHEVHLKQLRKLEKQFGLMNVKKKVEKRTSTSGENRSCSVKSEELNSIEANLKLKLKNMMAEEMLSLYQIRDLSKSPQDDENVNEIGKRITELERQVKRINAHEVHLKQLRKLEEQFELMNSKKKIEKGPSTLGENQSRSVKSEEFKSIEKDFKLKLKSMMTEEMTPLYQKIHDLYNYIDHLKQKITSLEKSLEANNMEYFTHNHREDTKMNFTKETPVIFQEVKVDKLFIDKHEQTNNFGQIGIKELSGHLNIGATYDKGIIPHELIEDWKQEIEKARNIKEEELEKEKMQNSDKDNDVHSQVEIEDDDNDDNL